VIGATVWPANAADYARIVSLVRSQLDEPAFAAAWTAGRALPVERATADGLAAEPADKQSGGLEGFDLTPRKREVAALLAQGLTNRQIGATLFITEGTARLNVKHILHKLGFAARAQLAGWAAAQGLITAPEVP
jgi:DNA-binding NarL/FixJ family response regulator